MKHGFIGFGNIAHALHAGLQKNQDNTFKYISKSTPNENLDAAKNIGDLAEWADVIWLCVKPQQAAEVLSELRGADLSNTIVVSPIAGVKISTLQETLGTDMPLVRIMPNLALQYGHSVTAFCASEMDDDVKKVYVALETMGIVLHLTEDKFDLFTALFGSGPAFLLRVLNVFQEQAIVLGISEQEAASLVLTLLKGTTAYLGENKEQSITELIAQVASKGGVTEAGLHYFDDHHIAQSFQDMISIAKEQSARLGT
ncbi:MAG: Pyrroline-5-carboxylate reductase [Candidatus Magasanikbacteria bacterium GW2011_GWD2_43_18]|uniref:Pyrroline-5-carboxylate reductase n=1 Tax=Candidatus Magasanikbacteria bacterium GW2011_GWE2_42_7 TaxID=1619052 RepID=A0A0G1DQY0_9BACT|nr:MAG: Pyrroline-5-carboxylate reductase [Candidatus Magasanikbacteria bacterium GW2011_GWC2_42_27]KKS73206.1 MAG: Pyrroline-5-carboxylate reductase [Candidatus Magasanikbacteria bacterium GW2011_GWE2_42_7]KKT03895.1 MAG: Pyrroline-5-carboxylate reductase [Candidatus Magasanikbacteria bacterium GW2011_GWD2_43_18]KKT25755.1 MAG: Pyrroline-5-carboxylate reductase [Candidatus Magasanikbacteria bacterium GW2011_GWA2_43_9]